MSVRPPRRIFRSSSPVRLPIPGLRWLAAGLGVLAAVMAGAAVLSELFGRPPAVVARIIAEPGQVAVVDGETLRLNGVVVRLSGIEAPERGEECRPGLDCGGAASRSLAALVRDRPVACNLLSGREDRPVGSCWAGDADLGRQVVAQGWARATTAEFEGLEQAARAAGLGQWGAAR